MFTSTNRLLRCVPEDLSSCPVWLLIGSLVDAARQSEICVAILGDEGARAPGAMKPGAEPAAEQTISFAVKDHEVMAPWTERRAQNKCSLRSWTMSSCPAIVRQQWQQPCAISDHDAADFIDHALVTRYIHFIVVMLSTSIWAHMLWIGTASIVYKPEQHETCEILRAKGKDQV